MESATNHLEQRELDRVREKSKAGFARAVTLSMLAANVHRIGNGSGSRRKACEGPHSGLERLGEWGRQSGSRICREQYAWTGNLLRRRPQGGKEHTVQRPILLESRANRGAEPGRTAQV